MTPHKRNPVAQYFADVWAGIATTYLGMKLTLRYCVGPPVTLVYPEQRPDVPKGYRGIHLFYEDKCAACMACAAACPVDCITIEALGKGKDRMMTRFDIDYSKCLFCDLCTPPCPSEAIVMGREYDLAGYTREDMIIKFARPKTADEFKAQEELLARKEIEKKAKLEAAKAEAAKKKAAQEKAAQEKTAAAATPTAAAGTDSNHKSAPGSPAAAARPAAPAAGQPQPDAPPAQG